MARPSPDTQNLTVRLGKSTIRRAKAIAASRGSSISRLVREIIEDVVVEDRRFQAARRKALRFLEQGFAWTGRIDWSREGSMSVAADVFVDTNILVYAHDSNAGTKRVAAEAVIRELWNSGRGLLSTQVLQEFYVTLTRKAKPPVPRVKARDLIETYRAWSIVVVDAKDVIHASEIEERYQLSFWDALLVAAASKASAATILSEDLSDGMVIEGIEIRNPLRT